MISICCPSRGRPALAKRMAESAINTAKNKNIEILFYLNDDDNELENYKKVLTDFNIYIGPDQSTCLSWNQLSDKAAHDYVFLMGDDVIFETENWDEKVIHEFEKYEDRLLVVGPWVGKNIKGSNKKTKACPHYIVHRNWINFLGYFAPPIYWHFYVDTHTQEVAKGIDRYVWLEDVICRTKKIIDDDTGKRVREHLSIALRDGQVWKSVSQRYIQADISLLKSKLQK